MKIPKIIEHHKHIFASYTAMALMNVQTVLNHIQKVTAVDGVLDNENYWEHPIVQLLNSRNSHSIAPEKEQEVMNKLLRHFPFLKIMAENQRIFNNKRKGDNSIRTKRLEICNNDLYYPLEQCLRVLKKYRDYTTHSYIQDDSWNDGSRFLKGESALSSIINNYYNVALRNVKDRYQYNTAQLAFIQDHRLKNVRDEDGKWRKVLDCDFFLSIQHSNGDKSHIELHNGTTKIDVLHLSGVGVVLLICLFLEKKYINTFLAKIHIHGDYANNSEEFRIIRRSMSINSILLPKERITSEKKSMSVALDMLNELKRCPRELFDRLSWEDQDRFRIVSSDYNEVLQMRSSDRFAQLSLQYIDYNKLFDRIRFHINMGKLRYLFARDKMCIDNQVRVRVLEHPLNGYGRLGDMEECRKQPNGTFAHSGIAIQDFEHMQRDDANVANYPYVVDTVAHYMLDNNKVEFCFCNDKILPEVVYDDIAEKWHVEKTIPSCRMSVLELPAMMFHMHLLGAGATERRITEVYNNYKKLFGAMSDGSLTANNIDSFGIARADMPQKVLDAVAGIRNGKCYNAFVKEAIETMIQETQRLIDRNKENISAIGSSYNKMGKRGFKQISSGKLADFLARDIVKFQPSLLAGASYGSDKITGLNYRVMQATIATYNEAYPYNDFYGMFEKAGLVGGSNRERNHPFLYSALRKQPQSAVAFYEYYLSARKRYLVKLLNQINEGEKPKITFAQGGGNKWITRNSNYYKVIGEIYLEDHAIELPRQMFDDEIKNALKILPSMSSIDYEQSNVTYLIGEYLKRECYDEFQSFYTWKRNYRYIDMLQCETDEKNSLVKTYTTTSEREKLWEERSETIKRYKHWAIDKKIADRSKSKISNEEFGTLLNKRVNVCRNEYQKDEKMIRRYKVQDALMFFMVLDTLKKNIEFNAADFRLKDIMPDADKGILSTIMPLEFRFEKAGKHYTIYTEGMKLKNYGDFFALAHDKRLDSLLDILKTNRINKDAIEDELDNYDTCRPTMAKLILDFEKMAYDKYPELKRLVNETYHFDFSALLQELILKGEFNRSQTYLLSQIRNAFSHNVYPNNGIIEVNTLPEIANHLIEMFGEYARIEE